MNDKAELNRAVKNLENDKKMSILAIKNEQEKMARMLRGSMGKDIDDVLSGKVKVKLSFFEKMKYKINFWLDKIFNAF